LDYTRQDDYRKVSLKTQFLNTSVTELAVVRNYIGLSREFDPTFKQDTAYQVGASFINYFSRLNYRSNITKSISYNASLDYGEYFNGTKLGTDLEVFYRYQPIFLFSMIINNNYIDLPGFEKTNLTRFGPKVELTLTNNLFFNYYLQFNSVSQNLSNNVRLQWRFKPLSDLFIVYTDNYGANSEFGNNGAVINIQGKQNKALILKFVYWLNL